MDAAETDKRKRGPGLTKGVIGFAAAALLFAVLGIYTLAGTLGYTTRSVVVTAEVIANDPQFSNTRSGGTTDKPVYRPTFGFVDNNGQAQQGMAARPSSRNDFAVGERVEIRYLPADPSKVRVDAFSAIWGYTALWLALAFAAFYAAVAVYRTPVKQS